MPRVAENEEIHCEVGGINEFELIRDGDDYLLFSHLFDTGEVWVRRAARVEELKDAIPIPVFSGRYPTVFRTDGGWNAWTYDATRGVTVRYLASHWAGPYRRMEDVAIYGASDWHVRYNARDAHYYASFKSIVDKRSYITRSPREEGPWTEPVPIFAAGSRADWHAHEEADPAVYFDGDRMYVTFAGWNSASWKLEDGVQRVGIVPLDPRSMQASRPAEILVSPEREWQRRGGSNKVFNPILLRNGDRGPLLLFYAHNPSAGGFCAGWGYIATAY